MGRAPASHPWVPATLVAVVAVLLVLVVASLVVALVRRRHARRDHVTGLHSRTGLLVRTAGLSRAAVAVVDFALVDRVVDTLGHDGGEVVLGLLAERLRSACRDAGDPGAGTGTAPSGPASCVIARLVGDRFALVLPGADAMNAERHLVALRTALAAPCVVEGLPFEVPVVVGVADGAGSVGAAGPVAAALRDADVALAQARRCGPAVCRYEPALGERAARRRALIRGFAEAIVGGQVRVHYQPLVCLDRRTVLGVEALARWEHPQLGALLPDEFVPVLESTGQIGDLTTFVLDEALAAARGWLDRGMRLSVAVNVSVANLTVATFPQQVAAALAVHRVPAELLTLELTESGVSAEREAARPVLAGLHALGCRLAVDDFGVGQSSLAHLRGLPVDQVKIDKSFVLRMHTEHGDSAVVRAIVEMGHTLGMTVVAEGVEEQAVRTALVEMGCDVAQGYLVSRPLPALGLERWLAGLDVAPRAASGEGPLTLIA